MKILYIVKSELNDTAKAMLEQHRKDAEVEVVKLAEDKAYSAIIQQVFNNDKVICW